MTTHSEQSLHLPVPVFWHQSMVQSFVEIAVSDAPFNAIELQQIACDTKLGHGVVVHRAPGQLELYVDRSFDVDEAQFARDPAFAHFEIAHFQQTDFDEARVHITGGELDASVRFTDRNGDTVAVKAHADWRRGSKPTFTPAPLQTNNQNLRFLVLNDLRLLRTRPSRASVSINGTKVALQPFLMPWPRLAPFIEARSGADLLLVNLVPPHTDRELLAAVPGSSPLDDGSVAHVGPAGLQSLEVSNQWGHFTLHFAPPFPDLNGDDWRETTTTGSVSVESSLGEVTTGSWTLTDTTPTDSAPTDSAPTDSAPTDSATAAATSAHFVLSELTQDWFPGLGRPAGLAVQLARRLRRRNQRWNYQATLQQHDDIWTSTGTWSDPEAVPAAVPDSNS